MNCLKKSRSAICGLLRGFRSASARAESTPAILREVPPYIRHSTFFSSVTRYHTKFHPPPFKAPARERRFYYVDRDRIHHFRRRGAGRWFENPRTVLLVVFLGSAGGITVYYGNLEAVPYTKRTHFILLSPKLERQLGESQFEQLKQALKDKLLPPTHPDSIRVKLIARDIVEALQKGLRKEDHVWSDPEYSSTPSNDSGSGLHWGQERETVDEIEWNRKDEMLDDRWVQQSRKAGEAKGRQPATIHLQGLNWEVVVVRNPATNAMCLPGGKIIVFTGLLDNFRSDAEIATVIGHEVGHAVARHSAEGITKNLWVAVLQLILYQFFALPDLINAMSNLLLKLPFSRRMEMEADYIGLLLLAAAGYDPRVAPKVYEKLGKITGDSLMRDYLSTHPSSRKRADLLSRAQVMGEALIIYQDAIAGRGVEGFL